MASPVLVFDDRDLSITYVGGPWLPGGVAVEYKATTTYTNQKGATASLNFSGATVLHFFSAIDH
jgi:hypothetical protein